MEPPGAFGGAAVIALVGKTRLALEVARGLEPEQAISFALSR